MSTPRVSPAAAAALLVLACLLFGLSSRRDAGATSQAAPRFQMSTTQRGEKGYAVFMTDTSTGQVWYHSSDFGDKRWEKLLEGPR